ncbi:hypothetical protein ABFS82_10G111900 [Erythranthe guttata]|uniref:Heptahelical transmembrane protein 1-like n=1 Tax=Erythranthe guttata TaxID=4155 RepID=A0A022PTT9_ERYGU|nr:PREDICTED: heptahelical transmembrane protein 1-like [Erythranthe guttata]EYU18238.1 hypothetical protein MIMGU_mgv1a009140mg [Erythranthe guttata]|eukprot:XP_012828602.1 PREDICTED: heptahelical transmembrane protein 1-like [Erythranthe guttata]
MDQENDQSIRFFKVAAESVEDRIISSRDEKMIISKRNKLGKRCYPDLVSFDELPDYMKDNEFILNYYRADWPLKLAFLSLFRWHNETLNVWTHLVGFLLFVGLTVAKLMHVTQLADFITMFTEQFPSRAEANISNKYSLVKQTTITTTTTKWPFYVILSGSMFCLLSSSMCHLFCCHSKRLNTHLLRMDYVGITVMIITSFFPPMYYIFICTPHWQIIYLTCITIMGACTITTTFLSPPLSSAKFRSFRALLFVCMGLFGVIPAVHAVVVNWNDPHRNVTLAYESVMGLSYLVGALFYVTRVPERWRPGWFDIAGHSHQIFHVFVVVGALAHYGAAHILFKYRSKMGCDTTT